jgi:drug/metabolite transporter (DMT)-like permease
MAVLLALASAATYGAADFLGGLSSRRAPAVAVTLVSQAAGLVVLLGAVAVLGGAPTRADLAWGAASGLAGGAGLLLLYRGLAGGTMSVVAPITAVCAAAVPVGAGLAMGERPSALALTGVVVALLAIVLVSREEAPAAAPRGPVTAAVRTALLAGVAFGLFFVLLGRTGDDAGLWPLVAARGGSIALLAVIGQVAGEPLRVPRAALGGVLAAGILDMTANVLYLLAVREGLLSLVAVLSSLYPASTVLLATVVLRERLHPVQRTGLAAAAAAVALIAAT